MHHDGSGALVTISVFLVTAAAFAYLLLAFHQRTRPRGWSEWRIGAFLIGCAVLILGLLPRFLPFPAGDFRKHMLQHLLIGMFAPLGLVMAAPVTLMLRTLPARYGRILSRALRSGTVHFFSNPVTAMTLEFGGMAALYFTPLYQLLMTYPAGHYALHLHFLSAGCLYTWVIAGPDPSPYRPSVPKRLVILGIAVVFHSVLAQMLYAGLWVAVAAPSTQLQSAAVLMYYGGDIAEMLLAFALVTNWHPGRKQISAQNRSTAPIAAAIRRLP